MSSTRDATVKPNSPSMKSTSAAVCSAETALRQNSSASPRKNCSYQFICICFLRILDRNVGETERRSTPVSGQKSEGLVSGRRNYSYAEITITRLRLFECPLLQVAICQTLPQLNPVQQCSNLQFWNSTDPYAVSGRCAFRNEWIWRTARGIRSLGSFHGYMLTSAFGASIAHSIATLYGCGGRSCGRVRTAFWHCRTESRHEGLREWRCLQ